MGIAQSIQRYNKGVTHRNAIRVVTNRKFKVAFGRAKRFAVRFPKAVLN